MSYDEWKLASPPEEEDDGRGHASYGETVAHGELADTLQHWKDGTRPGDDKVTAYDVMRAVSALVAAMIVSERALERERADALEHAR